MEHIDDSVEKWLINFRSPKTQRSYRHWFQKFQAFAKKTPKQLLDMIDRQEGGRLQVDDLTKQFYNQLLTDGYPSCSAYIALVSTRSFFKYRAERKLPPLPEAYAPPAEPAFEQRRVLTTEDFQKMLKKAETPFEELVLWMLGDGGQRRAIYTGLKLKHLKGSLLQDTPVVVTVPSELPDYRGINIAKKRRKFSHRFGFTAGTVNRLLEHLEQRRKEGEKTTGESWLLLAEHGKPPSADRINRIVERTAKAAGIQKTVHSKKRGRIRAIHAHIFRDHLNNRLKAIGETDDILRNMILGHRPPYAGAYDRYTDERILETYLKLSIVATS